MTSSYFIVNTSRVFVAPPAAPSNVSVVLVDKQLQVDWEVPIIEHVPLVFEVTLKTTMDQSVTIQDQQSWRFAIMERTCGPYQVEIVVSNVAGRSNATVAGTIPPLREAICHEVYAREQIYLAVTFTVSDFLS